MTEEKKTKSNDKKVLLLTWLAVLALIGCIVGATYAYFTVQMGEGTGTDINANTGTTDSLKFTAGKAISIVANQENFALGKGNLTDTTTAKAELIANNTTNSATYNYYVYLDILKNEFTYTTEESTAELILQITSPDGTPLTNAEGLNYVTIGDISGFDITTAQGLISIADTYEITAGSEAATSQEWNATLILVNLESNQVENAGKAFTAKLLIQQEEATNVEPAE